MANNAENFGATVDHIISAGGSLKVYNSENVSEWKRDGARAITIGNFDGCHLGHQHLLAKVRAEGQRLGVQTLALTFEPHPREFFSPGIILPRLYSQEQKKRLLLELGIDELYLVAFNQELAGLSHVDFFIKLRDELGMVALVVGDDFRFGRQRLGNRDYLHRQGQIDRIMIATEAETMNGDHAVSSSRIRQALTAGDIKQVNAMLGRPYALEGVIVKGAQLGRKIGFPTANFGQLSQLLPANGVYWGRVAIVSEGHQAPLMHVPAQDCFRAIANVGLRPTVEHANNLQAQLEVHLLDGEFGSDALYGRKLCFYLEGYLRAEQRFSSLADLKKQIAADCAQVRRSGGAA